MFLPLVKNGQLFFINHMSKQKTKFFMKKLSLFFFSFIIAFSSIAQVYTNTYNYGNAFSRGRFDTTLHIPVVSSLSVVKTNLLRYGALAFYTGDSSLRMSINGLTYGVKISDSRSGGTANQSLQQTLAIGRRVVDDSMIFIHNTDSSVYGYNGIRSKNFSIKSKGNSFLGSSDGVNGFYYNNSDPTPYFIIQHPNGQIYGQQDYGIEINTKGDIYLDHNVVNGNTYLQSNDSIYLVAGSSSGRSTTNGIFLSNPDSRIIVGDPNNKKGFIYNYNGTSNIISDSISFKNTSGSLSSPFAATATLGDSSNKLATTEFVKKAISSFTPSGNSTSNIRLGVGNTSLIVDTIQRYQAFPSIAMDRINYSYAEAIWKDANNHVDVGNIKWCSSKDGFSTFSSPETINVDGSPLTNAGTCMIGFGKNNRSVIAYNTGSGSSTDLTILYFAKSDTRDNNFISTTTMSLPSGISFLFPFGKTIIMPSGELRMLGYCQETAITAGQTSTCYFKSTDNGDSWSFGGIILHGGPMTGGPYTYPIGPSEADWDIVSTDGTDAGTKIVLIVRDDVNYRHIQLYSDNGGTTWVNTIQTKATFAFGDTWPGSPDAFWPCTLLCVNGYLYSIIGIRFSDPDRGFSMKVMKQPALSVYNDPAKWNPSVEAHTIYRSSGYGKYNFIDWGYIWPVVTSTLQVRGLYYDGDPNGVDNVIVNKTIDIKSLNLEGNDYYEAYNSTNVTIPSGVDSQLLFTNPWLDGNLYLNKSNNKIYCASDGWYDFYVRIKFIENATGKRSLSIYTVDQGLEAMGTGTPKKLIAKSIVTTPDGLNPDYIEVKGKAYWYANQELRVIVSQTSGGNLDIDNSGEDRMTIRFNKSK